MTDQDDDIPAVLERLAEAVGLTGGRWTRACGFYGCQRAAGEPGLCMGYGEHTCRCCSECRAECGAVAMELP